MRTSEHDHSGLDPLEEACLRRVMSRLRARLSDEDEGEAEITQEPERQHAAICGEIVID
jgi:hypothetical protein